MLFQTLLTDHFKLRFHRETKELPAYALTVDRSGPKLKLNESPEQFENSYEGSAGEIVGERMARTAQFWPT